MLLLQTDLVTNILFGVSGGLLSLVGLIAIFVTLNTQYNIEKARDVLWNLRETYQFYDFKNIKASHGRVNWLLNKYSKFIQLDSPIRISIRIGVITIFFVGLSWFIYLLFIAGEIQNDLLLGFVWILITVALLILTRFIYLLVKLRGISSFVNIPSKHDMEDATYRLDKEEFYESLSIAELALVDSKFTLNYWLKKPQLKLVMYGTSGINISQQNTLSFFLVMMMV